MQGGVIMKKENEEPEEKKEKKRKISLKTASGIAALTLIVGIVAGLLIYHGVYGLDEDEQKLVDEYNILKDEWLYGDEDTEYGNIAAEGLADGFSEYEDDSYTFYTWTYEDQGLDTEHAGFGFTSRYYDGNLFLTRIHDGPAEGKLYERDVIYAIEFEGETYVCKDHTYSEITSFLGADSSTEKEYVFHVYRGETEETVSLYKSESYLESYVDIIKEPTADDKTLGVRINTFLGSPTTAMRNVLDSYEDGEVENLVIDLRGNGGGYVSEATAMSKLFVEKGTLIYQLVDKDGNVTSSSTQTTNPVYTYDNISLIIDEDTASASETFTLAMRAGTDCTVYGLTSYGKGIAQSLHTFDDGSTLRYTSAYVYGPERENETMYDEGEDDDDVMCINGKGIIPDVEYSFDYGFMDVVFDFTQSIAVSETAQLLYLEAMNTSLPSYFEESYSSNYHFTDAIEDFASYACDTWDEIESNDAFSEDGTVLKSINDKINKVVYDEYLVYYDDLTDEVLNG